MKTGKRLVFLIFLGCFALPISADLKQFGNPAPKGMPDLRISIQAGPSLKPVFPGSDIHGLFNVTVRNHGTAPAANFMVEVVLSAQNPSTRPLHFANGKVNVKSLAAGATLQVDFPKPVTLLASIDLGNYSLLAGADTDAQVKESNEANNTDSLPLVVWCRIGNATQENNVSQPLTCGKVGVVIAQVLGIKPSTPNVSVRIGDQTLAISKVVLDPDYNYIQINAVPVSQIALGRHPVFLVQNGKRMSNEQNILWGIVTTGVQPSQGPAGCSVAITCCNAGSQVTKKVYLIKDLSPGLAYEMPVASWSNTMIMATIPAVPPGHYHIMFKDQGQFICSQWLSKDFTVQ
jgi:hypothetical protein